jgi:hypothetical protein
MDSDDHLVLLRPEGDSFGLERLLAGSLIEGNFVGGDPRSVYREKIGPSKQGSGWLDVHAVFSSHREDG